MNILDGPVRTSLLEARRGPMVEFNIPREAITVSDRDPSRLARDVKQDLDGLLAESCRWVQISLGEVLSAFTGDTVAATDLASHVVVPARSKVAHA